MIEETEVSEGEAAEAEEVVEEVEEETAWAMRWPREMHCMRADLKKEKKEERLLDYRLLCTFRRRREKNMS